MGENKDLTYLLSRIRPINPLPTKEEEQTPNLSPDLTRISPHNAAQRIAQPGRHGGDLPVGVLEMQTQGLLARLGGAGTGEMAVEDDADGGGCVAGFLAGRAFEAGGVGEGFDAEGLVVQEGGEDL